MIILLGCAYHLMLGFFVFFSWLRWNELHHYLPLYVQQSKIRCIREYVLLCLNFHFTIFSIVYVYLIILCSNNFFYVSLECMLLICYFFMIIKKFQIKILGFKLVVLRVLCNFPNIIVFHFSTLQSSVVLPAFYDFLFFYLNMFRIVLSIYEIFSNVHNESINRIKNLYSKFDNVK